MLSPDHVDAAVNDIARQIFRAFRPPPNISVDEWADNHRQLSRVSNATGGRWRTRCYQREIMREMTNPVVRSVCVVGAAQTVGKTELHLNFIGRQIHLNPGPMLLVLPNEKTQARISKKRIAPMLRDTPALAEIVGRQKTRSSSSTISAKEFPGGSLNLASANNPADLASDPIRDVMIDEVDRAEAAAGNEGDPVGLAEQRQETFGDQAFSLYTSSPSGKKPRPFGDKQPAGVSKILLLFGETDQRHWFCPCQNPACRHEQRLTWGMVRFDDSNAATARIECEKCGHKHDDAQRVAMIEQGRWQATAPFDGRRGYFLNGIYSLSKPQRGCPTRLYQMVRDFLRATRRGAESLRAWANTFLCECFQEEDETERPTGELLLKKREVYGERLPNEILLLAAGIDVQRGDKCNNGRVEMVVVGFGEDEQTWGVDYQVVTGDPEHPALWQQVDALLQERYVTRDGRQLIIERCAIDTGFAADAVYNFCQGRGARVIHGEVQRVIAVKGFKGVGRPVMNLPQKSGVKRTRLWLIATNTAKLWVYGQIAKTLAAEPGAGPMHFPSDRAPLFGEDYFRQLTAEPTQRRFLNGVEFTDFLKPEGRNEILDATVYALGAVRFSPPNWAKLKLRAGQGTPEEIQREQEEVRPPVRQAPSFVGVTQGWRI